ncbi:hypothetical protein QBC40DRAFT_101074 [Triangularia verruculosa]|uniref:BZIP domain-containing protein n=1 Tax=Triangularia verruculosa TaxID=2587418 RepID=A0AAN6XFJ9_9PEZI|nr:hypothetical protein QBC40DRAFT_101074 [Triangularia verruculosa]
MAAAAAASPVGSGNTDKRTLFITTTLSRDSPSAASTPASAASPSNVSTPTSSTSVVVPPIAIRPNAPNRPPSIKASAPLNMASPGVNSPGSSVSQPMALSMTSKEWVIPPRPKPGRKPATDTPPTKRKAQNRAAQRAFRERRAARVGELEEQLDEQKEEHERVVQELQERINHLETERHTLHSRCQWLQSQLDKERQGRNSVVSTWDSQSSPSSGSNQHLSTSIQSQTNPLANVSHPRRPLQPAPPKNAVPNVVPTAGHRTITQPFSISHIISPPDELMVPLGCGGCETSGSCACAEAVLQDNETAMGCGKCTFGSNCECLEEALRLPDLKRPHSPSSPPSAPEEKRQRSDAGLSMETDFTAMFAKDNRLSLPSVTQPPAQSLQPMMSLEARDSCGFCKDGTYCMCAEALMNPMPFHQPLPPAQPVAEQTQTHTPPPSEDDVVPIPMEVTATGAIKLPGPRANQNRSANTNTAQAKPSGGRCGPNGPGTCAQCLSDPKSGLFCRSLAANFQKNNPGASGSGCCGGAGPGGGCCKSGKTDTAPAAPQPLPPMKTSNPNGPSEFPLALSCAEAYKTLASHRHFDQAADEIGTWLPKLKALPVPQPGSGSGPGGQGGRNGGASGGGGQRLAPIEVEAASIMSVLKDFDIRFGRGD